MKPIAEIRKFNRFYTSLLGMLNHHILDSPYSLTESLVLYEIGHTENCTATYLVSLLRLDRGYLSRLLKRFQTTGLILRRKTGDDHRVYYLSLTEKGSDVLTGLIQSSEKQISQLIEGLSPHQHNSLVTCMKQIQEILGSRK